MWCYAYRNRAFMPLALHSRYSNTILKTLADTVHSSDFIAIESVAQNSFMSLAPLHEW